MSDPKDDDLPLSPMIEVPQPERAIPSPRVRIAQEIASRRLRLPTREELAALALDVYRLALDREKTYTTSSGKKITQHDPDFRGAIDAARLVGELAGHLGKGAGPVKQASADEDERHVDAAEEALDKLRARVSKRMEVANK